MPRDTHKSLIIQSWNRSANNLNGSFYPSIPLPVDLVGEKERCGEKKQFNLITHKTSFHEAKNILRFCRVRLVSLSMPHFLFACDACVIHFDGCYRELCVCLFFRLVPSYTAIAGLRALLHWFNAFVLLSLIGIKLNSFSSFDSIFSETITEWLKAATPSWKHAHTSH